MNIMIGKPIGATPSGEVVFNANPSASINNVGDFKRIVNEMAKTYERKNTDYGDSFSVSVRKYGNIAALTRMSDKFNRIENLILNGNAQVKDESLLDSLKDLGCYCVMTVMAIESNDFEDVK